MAGTQKNENQTIIRTERDDCTAAPMWEFHHWLEAHGYSTDYRCEEDYCELRIQE